MCRIVAHTPYYLCAIIKNKINNNKKISYYGSIYYHRFLRSNPWRFESLRKRVSKRITKQRLLTLHYTPIGATKQQYSSQDSHVGEIRSPLGIEA